MGMRSRPGTWARQKPQADVGVGTGLYGDRQTQVAQLYADGQTEPGRAAARRWAEPGLRVVEGQTDGQLSRSAWSSLVPAR